VSLRPAFSRKHFSEFVDVGSSSQNIEDLKKQVHTLGEKLIGYEETKEQLTQAQSHLALYFSSTFCKKNLA